MLDDAIVANEQAKYVLGLLQIAANNADNPSEAAPPTLKSEREACGLGDASFDRCVADSLSDGHRNYHIPGAQRLIAVLDEAMAAMLAPLALTASSSDAATARHERYRRRLGQLVRARPAIVDDMLNQETITAMTSGGRLRGTACTC